LVPDIETCVVVGDRAKFLSILITLKTVDISPEEKIKKGILMYNDNHSVSNAQKIQKFHILPRAFSVETGELTPTLKLKRKFIAEKYQAEIASLCVIPR
jgi:long-chain-fatty-acid--CoA ligase ACSBG